MSEPRPPYPGPPPDASAGRLSARPAATAGDTGPTGVRHLDLDGTAAATAYVPAADAPRRLVVLLHGAGGRPRDVLRLLRPAADTAGLLLLAPASIRSTWDVITGGYGPDVVRIDRCVAEVSAHYRVRPGTYVLAGFSDGASYALSLGVANGDLVDAVLAFSPGFLAAPLRTGRPAVFVSHGTADRVLPVDRSSRRLVPRLRADGYDVTYDEFAGGHDVPPAVLDRAVRWLADTGGP